MKAPNDEVMPHADPDSAILPDASGVLASTLCSALCCPQCGEECDQLTEGYCERCRDQRQQQLDDHNFSFSEWESLTADQKEQRIKHNP